MTYFGDKAFPALSDEQWARLQAYGSAQEVESGALLWGAGEATYDLILVDSGEAEVARAATARAAEAVVARFGTGQFAGELSLLTGRATYLSARGRCCAVFVGGTSLRDAPHDEAGMIFSYHDVYLSCQFGARFSMKAPMPSSASAAIMFSVMTCDA